MSQLRIDYENASRNLNANGSSTPNTSPNFKVLRGTFSTDSLAKKLRQLRRVRPKLAAVIEGLVDDALREAKGLKL